MIFEHFFALNSEGNFQLLIPNTSPQNFSCRLLLSEVQKSRLQYSLDRNIYVITFT